MAAWTRRSLVLVLVLSVAAALRWTLFAPEPVAVTAEAAARGAVEQTVSNSRAGTVRAQRRAQLSPEAGGQVVAIPFREGQAVARGDVVLRLDDTVQSASLDLARRDLETARAERERTCLAAQRAARELERGRRLAEERILAEDSIDQLDTSAREGAAACQAADARIERAAAAMEVAAADLRKRTLVAPFDGLIAEVSIEIGEWTTPSPPALPVPPVLDVLDPSSLYVSAPIDEVDSARIVVGQPVRITVDSFRDRGFPGTVRRIAPYVLDVEEQNRTVEIEADFTAPPPDRLLPGTSADVEVLLEVHEDALRVPTPAVMEGQRVLVLEEGVLRERHLTVGLRNWDFTEVLGGLEEGELVVTSLDRPEVRAGAKARVADAP
jgi:HlyD family secretion protein